jgi:PPIC-type PPIASE domain
LKVKPFVKKLLHEPLFQFLLIGAGLFLIFGWRGGSASQPGGQAGSPSTKIIVSQGLIEHLTAQFTRTWQRQPTEQELKDLIDIHVRDEISYREAMAMGLDRDDPTIRRRMRLKLEMLNEDIAAAMSPTDRDLQAFLEKHPDSFREEPRAAFRQVFLNPDRRGANVEPDARNLLARLRASGPGADLSGFGDSLMMLPNDLPLSTLSEIGRLFGKQFGRNIVKLEPGQWQGPVLSGYGMHLVLVTERQPARLPELAEVRDQVEREWLFARKKKIQEAMYEKLAERYTVVIEESSDTKGKGAAVAATPPARAAQ